MFPLNFILINALKMGKPNFWQIMSFDPESGGFSPIPSSVLDSSVFAFFSRLFLWQRWESVSACSKMPLPNDCSTMKKEDSEAETSGDVMT